MWRLRLCAIAMAVILGSPVQSALLAQLGIKNDPGANTPTATSPAIASIAAPGFLDQLQRQEYQPPPPVASPSSSFMGSSGGPTQRFAGQGGVQLLVDAAKRAGFKDAGLLTAVAVGLAESEGNPNATNTAGNSAGTDRGLWQINDYYHRDLFNNGLNWADPYANAQAAYNISGGGSNWQPWSTYNSGAYRSYIRQASQALGMGG